MHSLFVNHQTFQKLMHFVNYKDSTFRRVYKVKQKFYHSDADSPEKEYELVFKDEAATIFFMLRYL
jgi:hypothetical protein